MPLKDFASLAVLALVVALAVAEDPEGDTEEFDNELDGDLSFECPRGKVLGSVYSVHDNSKEDRRWRLGCKKAPAGAKPKTCRWTDDYVNDWDEAVSFMCPANFILSGINSTHSNAAEDRRMKMKCCRKSAYKATNCVLTPYLNDLDGVLDYTVPKSKVITGWFSVHSNSKEDRRHKLIVCSYKPKWKSD
ncbi:hypothetical protein RRG08_054239 [Elysia crispata]|uniref:Dermatopontin n=1 Tax=Elysia crispata TaxID=231223 RepID=A0AAE1CWP6_9GAST|nr:hypothetical protein RRG08_054239 [Elysia crispata]